MPDRPWQHATMDFITDLPPSRFGGQVYDAILVIVDRFSKMAHYVPARMDWDGTDLAEAWIRDVIRLHGNPETVISDRGPLMKSKYWDTFHHYLNSRRVLSSAFHPTGPCGSPVPNLPIMIANMRLQGTHRSKFALGTTQESQIGPISPWETEKALQDSFWPAN